MREIVAVIQTAEMSKTMQQDALECATQVIENLSIDEQFVAEAIKFVFDEKYGPTWDCKVDSHCILYHVAHQPVHLVNFYLDGFHISLYKRP